MTTPVENVCVNYQYYGDLDHAIDSIGGSFEYQRCESRVVASRGWEGIVEYFAEQVAEDHNADETLFQEIMDRISGDDGVKAAALLLEHAVERLGIPAIYPTGPNLRYTPPSTAEDSEQT